MNGDNFEEINGLLEQIFQPTFDEATTYTQQLIQYNYDIFGVLISIRVANQLQFESERRGIPSMFDSFLNGQLIQLWPRFQQLVDFQCESLRKAAITTNVAKYAGNSSTSNSSPLTSPHELTVQFGKFLSSFLTLAITHKQSIDERSEPCIEFIYEFLEKKLEAEYSGDLEKFLGNASLDELTAQLMEESSGQEESIPPAVLLRARICAYEKNEESLNKSLESVHQKQADLEGRFRRVLSLCLKIDEDKVDDMLDGLLQAISTEDPEDIDTDEMQSFLSKHNV